MKQAHTYGSLCAALVSLLACGGVVETSTQWENAYQQDAAAGAGGTAKTDSGLEASKGGSSGKGGTAGAAGVAGAGGVGGAGGMAGAGGTPDFCASLEPTGEPQELPGAYAAQEFDPKITSLGEDQLQAVVAVRCVSTQPGSLTVVSHAAFQPWGPWPDVTLKQAYYSMTSKMDGLDYVVAQGYPGLFALAVPVEPESYDPVVAELTFSPAVAVGKYLDPTTTTVLSTAARRPLFATLHGATHLLGFEQEDSGHFSLQLGVVKKETPFAEPLTDLACATLSIVADAIPFGEGFLAVWSSSRPFHDCGQDDGADGPPKRIQLVRVSLAGDLELVYEMEQDFSLAWLDLLPLQDGAWLAAQTLEGKTNPSPFAVRLDASGVPVGAPVPAGPVGSGVWAAAVLADKLVLGTPRQQGPSDPEPDGIAIYGVEDQGGKGKIGQSPYKTPFGASALSLFPSPAGDQLLLAYSGVEGPGGKARVRVARLGCTATPSPGP